MNKRLCKALQNQIIDEEKGAKEYHELTDKFARLDDVDTGRNMKTM